MGSNAWCQIAQKEPWETGIAAYNEPNPVPGLEKKKIASVVAGDDFSLALSENGELFSWGVGRWGQLGDGQGKHVKPRPSSVRRAPFDAAAKGDINETSNAQIACGAEHCLALLANGQLWSWVRSRIGPGVSYTLSLSLSLCSIFASLLQESKKKKNIYT